MTRLTPGEAQIAFPPDHPALPGHFPGRPRVPGVLLLDAVLGAMFPEGAMARIENAKFLAGVGPGDPIAINWDAAGAFSCTVNGRPVLRGRAQAA